MPTSWIKQAKRPKTLSQAQLRRPTRLRSQPIQRSLGVNLPRLRLNQGLKPQQPGGQKLPRLLRLLRKLVRPRHPQKGQQQSRTHLVELHAETRPFNPLLSQLDLLLLHLRKLQVQVKTHPNLKHQEGLQVSHQSRFLLV